MSTNASIITAFAAGLLSFLSPCCLPLVPGYLSGVAAPSPNRASGIFRIGSFLAGFASLFILLGLSASTIGGLLNLHQSELRRLAGVVVLIAGIATVLPFARSLWDRTLIHTHVTSAVGNIARRFGDGGPFLLGTAFAIAWTPCIGPVLGGILTLAAVESGSRSVLLLTVYTLGLCLPFLALGLGYGTASARLMRMTWQLNVLRGFGAAVLITMGVMLLADEFHLVNSWMQRAANSTGFGWTAL